MVNSFLFNEKPVWVGNNNYGLTPVSDSLIGNNIEVTENDMRHYSGDYITVSPKDLGMVKISEILMIIKIVFIKIMYNFLFIEVIKMLKVVILIIK